MTAVLPNAYEDLSAEIKQTYPDLSWTYENTFRVEAPYRETLLARKNYGLTKGSPKFLMKLNGSWAVGSAIDFGVFPATRVPTTTTATITPVMFEATVSIGLKTSKIADTGDATFNAGGILADRMGDTFKSLAAYMEKCYVGGIAGRLTTVSTDGSSNFVAAAPWRVSLLEEGMSLEATTTLTSHSIRDSFSGHRITAIDLDTFTVTYVKDSDGTTDDRTLVAGDSIFLAGTNNQGPVGLPEIVDNGDYQPTLYGITRSSFPKTYGFVQTGGGTPRPITDSILQDALAAPRDRIGQKITRLLGNSGQWRAYLAHIAESRFFPQVTGDPRFTTGAAQLAVTTPDGSVVFEVNRDVTPGSVYGLAFDQFCLYQGTTLDWVTLGDGGPLKLVPTGNGYLNGLIGYAQAIEQQVCFMPRANVRVDDLKDKIIGT